MRSPASAAIGIVGRRAWQRGWQAQLGLFAITALTVAMAVGMLTGADQAQSALTRLRAQHRSTDLGAVLRDGATDIEGPVAAAAASPGVVAAGAFQELFVRPVGSDLFPNYQLLVLAPVQMRAGDTIDVPVVVSGRAADPAAADEAMLSEALAEELGLAVGDRLSVESMSYDWVEKSFDGLDPGPPDGPRVDLRVVGLARTPADFGRWVGTIHLTPAFVALYGDDIRTYTNVEVRLSDRLAEQMRNSDRFELPLFDEGEVQPSYHSAATGPQDGLDTISMGLRLMALASAAAGLAAVGLAAVRLAREVLVDQPTLIALGWTRAEMVRLVGMVLAPWAILGVVAGAVFGVTASPLASIGLAHAIDPDDGAAMVSARLLTAATAGALVLVIALVLGASVRASRTPRSATAGQLFLPPLAVPLAVPLGVRRAFFAARDGGGRASRGATVAAAAAVTIAVAALAVGSSIQRLQDDPTLSGQGAADERGIDIGEDPAMYEPGMRLLEGDDRVAELIGFQIAFDVTASGVEELTTLIHDVRRGDPHASLIAGRIAAQPDEVTVGPRTLEEMGLSVGDIVELTTRQGHAGFRIVGSMLFPEGDFEHDAGVAMTAAGATRVHGGRGTGGALFQIAYAWDAGVDAPAADLALEAEGFRVLTPGTGVRPPVVTNLGQVRSLPPILAALVIALGLLTLLYAVSLTSRAQDREAATLRAIGVTRRTAALVIEAHGGVMALTGVVVGVPLGIALGRQVWSVIAGRANLLDRPEAATLRIGWVVLALVAGAAITSLPLVSRAWRQRPIGSLRAE